MLITCPVCGHSQVNLDLPEFEEEVFRGGAGAEMKITIRYCNVGDDCNAVHAANFLDKMAEPFYDAVGYER